MRTNASVCPNCGGWLETHREETQPAGGRFVHLHWVICRACRHVALRDWSIFDELTAAATARVNGHEPE
jgi:hypothetical protein